MSPKELLYIEDALGHAKFMQTAQQLQDAELKNCVQQMATKYQDLFNQFYQLV